MSLIEFPYIFHKAYSMPIIPVTIHDEKVWVYVDSGAAFTILSVDDAHRIGIDWQKGRQQMIVVGDGSFIPTYFHNLAIQIDKWQVTNRFIIEQTS